MMVKQSTHVSKEKIYYEVYEKSYDLYIRLLKDLMAFIIDVVVVGIMP